MCDPGPKHPITPSDAATSSIFDTFCSSLPAQMTRAEALARALPFEDEGTKSPDSSSLRQATGHFQTEAEGSYKRRKLGVFVEVDDILDSRSTTPEIKVEEHASRQAYESLFPENSVDFNIKRKLPQSKKKRPNQRTNVRAKMLWTDQETADLIKGVNLFGYGRWKKVLNHPDLKFLAERTSVDLKDRYRTCLNNGWATNTTKTPAPPRKRRRKSDASIEFFPTYASNTPPRPDSHYNTTNSDKAETNYGTTPLSHPPSPRMHFPVRTRSTNKSKTTVQRPRRKQKQPWTRKEDGLLWAGYKKHGFKWRAIAKDDSLGLTHRRCTAIRDRFRLMLPSLYMDNVDIEKGVVESGKRKIHWSLRKLVGRDLDGPDPVLLALSEEGPGEEEGEATFTDQDDGDGDDEDDEDAHEPNSFPNANGLGENCGESLQFEDVDYGLDSLNFEFSTSEPLIQRYFNDEDFDLGYDEDADEDYHDDGVAESEGFSGFLMPPEFGEYPPDFSELWNDNDENGRDADSEEGSEDDEEQDANNFEDFLENRGGQGSNASKNDYNDDPIPTIGREVITAAPLLWEEMATQPIFDLEVDDY